MDVYIVTGASKGIGFELSKQLSRVKGIKSLGLHGLQVNWTA